MALISLFDQGNFCAGIDFHVTHLKNKYNWNTFNTRYALCKVAFIRRGFIKFLR